MKRDDPYIRLEEDQMPFPEVVVVRRKKRLGGGITASGPIIHLPPGLHYLSANSTAARAFQIFRQIGT